MNIKKLFFILVATLMACIACTRQQDAIEPEVTSQIIEVESIPEIETPAPTSTVTPVVTATPVAVEEQPKIEKLPKGAKVFVVYDEIYRVYRKGKMFYFCSGYEKPEVLAKTKLEDPIKANFMTDSLWPFVYSKKGNLYIVQAKIEEPKLEFIKVAENVEEAGVFYIKEFQGVPVWKEKKGGYKTVFPESPKAYEQYVCLADKQTVPYSSDYKKVKVKGKDITVKFSFGREKTFFKFNVEAEYYWNYNGKKYEFSTNFFPINVAKENFFFIDMIKEVDKAAARQIEKLEKRVRLKNAKKRIQKIQSFLDDWEKDNADKIYQYYKKHPKKLSETCKNNVFCQKDLKKWLKKYPKYKKGLDKVIWKKFLNEK